MSDLFNDTISVESIVKFIREAGPTPPGPVPPGPVPPGPTPGPTPVPDPGSWVAQTGDALLMLVLALLAMAAIGFFMFCFTRRKAIIEGGEVFGGPLSFLNKKTKSKFLLVISTIILAFTTILCATYISSHADQASAFGDTQNSLNVETKPVTYVHVYDDGVTYDSTFIKNNDDFEVSISSVIANSSVAEVSDVVWTLTAEDVVTPIFSGVANPAEPTKCDVAVGAYATKNIGVSSNISYDLAKSIATEAGTDVLKITFQVQGEGPVPPPPVEGNLLANAPDTTEYGLLEDRFHYVSYNPLLATSVEFKDISQVDVSKARNAENPVDLSNDHDGSILGYVMDDQVANSYKLSIVANGKIKANVTSLSRMFKNFRNLYTIDYSNLDTSIAKDVSYMFEGAGRDDGVMGELNFNSLPTNATFSFADGCDLSHMFDGCNASVDISALNIANVVNMDYMFHNYCKAIATAGKAKVMPTLKLSNSEGEFKIPAGCSTYHMFDGCAFDLTPVEGINVLDQIDFSNAKNFSGMFKDYCTGQDGKVLDLRNVDMSNAQSMEEMFAGAFNGVGDSTIIFPENIKLTENVSSMFEGCDMYELDLSSLDFSRVNNMSNFFDGYGFKDYLYENVVVWPENMTTADNCDVSYMFANSALYPHVLEKWDASKIGNMEGFFYNYGKTLAGDILFDDVWTIKFPENYKVASGCSLAKMFQQAYCHVDLSNMDASAVTDFSHMFDSFGSVTPLAGQECNINFGENFETGVGSNFSHMFEAVQLTKLDLTNFNMNNGTDFSYMFRMVGQNLNILAMAELPIFTCKIEFPETVKPEPKKSFFDSDVPVIMDYMFAGYRFRTDVDTDYALDLSTFDFTNVTSMVNMFSDYNNFSILGSCVSVNAEKNIILPDVISTAKGADMSEMFKNSNAFTDKEDGVYRLKFKISKAGNIRHMFDSAFGNAFNDKAYDKFMIDLTGSDYSNVEDASYMFANAFYKTPDGNGTGSISIPNFIAKAICNATHMFDGVSVFDVLNIGTDSAATVDFSKFGDLGFCFANLGSKEYPISISGLEKITVTSATNLQGFFYNSYIINAFGSLDLTSWDISDVTDMSYLFYGLRCTELDIHTWNPKSCSNMEGMFKEFGNELKDGAEKSIIKFPDSNSKDKDGKQIYWTTGDNCSMKNMFELCMADVDLSYFKVDKVTSMERMFLAYGSSYEQILSIIRGILPFMSSVYDEDGFDVNALAQILVNTPINDKAGNYFDQISYAEALIAESRSYIADRALSSSTATIQNTKLEAGSDGTTSSKTDLSTVSSDGAYEDALSSANVNGNYYSNDFNSTIANIKSESVYDLGDALSRLLDQIDLDKYKDSINETMNKNATPNALVDACKIVLPAKFNPGTNSTCTDLCTMRAMFAFCNALNTYTFYSSTETDYTPNLNGFDTSKVNDMSFMFAGYYLFSTFNGNDQDVQIPFENDKLSLDISSFDTSNVKNMSGMFMIDGLVKISYYKPDEGWFYNNPLDSVDIKFGEDFKINATNRSIFDLPISNVLFMFTGCFANLENFDTIDTSDATDLSFMFTLANIRELDISHWNTANVKDMKYMFAFYGLADLIMQRFSSVTNIQSRVDNKFNLTIGSSSQKFEIGQNVDVTRMFMLPGFCELDLSNVKTTFATNLSRMFEMCILYNWLIRDGMYSQNNCGINIISWETANVKNFDFMFSLAFASDIKLPGELKTADGATMVGMFMNAATNTYKPTDISPRTIYYDVSSINFSKVSSTACMFKGFDIWTYLFNREAQTHFGSYLDLGEQNMTSCSNMSSMFEMCPLGINMKDVKVRGLKNANRMFAFSGYTHLEIDRDVPIASALLKLLTYLSANLTEIQLPSGSLSFMTEEGASADFMFLGAKSGDLSQSPITSTIDGAPNKSILYSIIPSKIDISFLQTGNIKSMEGIFMLYNGSLDLTSLNLNKCVNAKRMFSCYGITNLTNIFLVAESSVPTEYILEFFMDIYAEVTWPSSLQFNEACRTDYMFTQYLARPDNRDGSYIYDFSFMNVSNLHRFDYMFAYGFGLYNYDLSSWDMSSATSLNHMFQGYGLLLTSILDVMPYVLYSSMTSSSNPAVKSLIWLLLEKYPISSMKFMHLPSSSQYNAKINMVGMFSWATFCSLKINAVKELIFLEKTLDLQDWDFSSVKNASYAFAGYGLGFLTGVSLYDDIRNYLKESRVFGGENSRAKKSSYFETEFPTIKFNNESVKFADGVILDGMFALADSNVDFIAFDSSTVASCEAMFAGFAPSYSTNDNDPNYFYFEEGARKIRLNIPNNLTFNNEAGASIAEMFMFFHPDTIDVSNWDTSKVTDMTRTFAFSKIENVDVYNWNTSSCKYMIQTFAGSTINCVDMSKWDFSNVVNMQMMFAWFGNLNGCSLIYFPVEGMITAPGCVADSMFRYSRLTSILLYGLNIDNISSVDYMFADSTKLQTIHVSESVDWTNKRLAGTYMFLNCENLVGSKGTAYMKYHTNIEYARTDKGVSAPGYFSTTHSLREPSNYSTATDDSQYKSIFMNDENYNGFTEEQLEDVYKVEFKTGDVSDMVESETAVDVSWANDGSIFAILDTNKGAISVISEGTIYSRQKSLVNMFNWKNSKLKYVVFENGIFDTVAADSTYGMFQNCINLQYVDLHTLNMSNTQRMSYMFCNVGTDTLNGSCLDFVVLSDPNNVTSWSSMFNTSTVKDMSHMFESANVHSTWIDDTIMPLNLVTFDVKNVSDLSYMFAGFEANTVKFSDEKSTFAPKKGCSFVYMFANSNVLTYLDLSSFEIPDKGRLDYMFYKSSKLESIYVGSDFYEINDWGVAEDTTSSGMFTGCESLKGDDGFVYEDYNENNVYNARPNIGEYGYQSGYFSTSVKLDLSDFDIDVPYVGFNANYNVDISFIKDSNLDRDKATKANDVIVYMAEDCPILVYVMMQGSLANPRIDIIFASNQDLIPYKKHAPGTEEEDIRTCEDMFHKGFVGELASSITNITFDNIDFTNTISTKNMFSELENLTKLYFYNAKGDLSSVENASSMFAGCSSLITVDTAYWYLDSAYIDNMFDGCSSLKTIYANEGQDWTGYPCSSTVFDGCTNIIGGGSVTYGGPEQSWATVNGGYFTYGALMKNYDEENDLGVMEYVMESYYRNHSSLYPAQLTHDLIGWYQKQCVSSVDFYADFENSEDYDAWQYDYDYADVFDISQYGDNSVKAYIYSYKVIRAVEILPIVQKIPILRDVNIPLYRIAISTSTELAGRQIIADTETLKYMFRGFTFLDWANLCEGWSGINFSKDVNPEEFQIFNTSAARSAKGMFMDTYTLGVNESYQKSPELEPQHPVLDLTLLDTSSVNDFSYMFCDCQVGELRLSSTWEDETAVETSKFSIANASNLSYMFWNFGRLVLLSHDQYKDHSAMFIIDFPSKLFLPKEMKTNNLCNASYMFYFAHVIDMDLRNLNFDNFYNMDGMFSFAGAFRFTGVDLFSNKSEKQISYDKLREFALALRDSNAQKCEEWLFDYYNQTENEFGNGFCSVITFNQGAEWGPKVECSANEMFRGCTCGRIYADRFDTGQITSMRAMFQLTPFIQYIFVENQNDGSEVSWNTESVTDMSEMFSYCGSVDGTSRFGVFGPGTDPDEPGDFPVFTFQKDCKVGRMFERCNLPVNLENCVCSDNNNKFGLNNIRDYTDMFYQYAYFALPSLIGTPEELTVKLCTSKSKSDWKPLENASMYQMFRGCKANIDLSRLDTSTVNDFGGMFMSFGNGDVEALYDNVGVKFPTTFKTAENANMSRMFKGYKGFGYAGDGTKAPDLTTFDTSKVVNMSEMFRGCKLHELDLNTWDTSMVRDFSYMFSSELLRESYVETIKLGKNFVVDEAVDMTCMFGSDLVDNDVLRTIECPNDWASVINQRLKTEVVWTDSMFAGCYKLVGNAQKNPTTYDVDYLKHTLARPGYTDASGEIHRGYFTCYEFVPTNNNEAVAESQDNIPVEQLDSGEVKELNDSETFKAFKDGFVKAAGEIAEPLAYTMFNLFIFFNDFYVLLFVG